MKGAGVVAALGLAFAQAASPQVTSKDARPAAAACGGMETVQLQTFRVEMETGAPRYKVGRAAKFHVTVHRRLPQDPAGTGLYYDSPYEEPAAEIPVGVGLRIGDAYLYNFGVTHADGHTTISIKLKPLTPAGWASATAFASKARAESPCANVVEVGYTSLPKAFKATRPNAS